MMDEVAVRVEYELPVALEDLTRFVLVGREKLIAVRAEIRAIEKVGLAKSVREQKLQEAQLISEAVLDAEVRIGELMREVPKAVNNNPTGRNQYGRGQSDSGVDLGKKLETNEPKAKATVIREAGFTPKQVERFQQLAAHPEIVEQAKAEARENDDIVSRSLVLNMIRTQKKADEIEQAKKDIAEQSKASGTAYLRIGDSIGYRPAMPYDLLLTDPPYSTDVEDIESFAQSWLPNALEHVKPTGSAYVFIGAYPDELRAYLNVAIPKHMELAQVLIWTYKNTLGNNPKARYKQNYQAVLYYRGKDAPPLDCPLTNEQWAVQEVNAPDGRIGDRYHEWQKPMELAERFIRHSTKQGDTVFDPFACTGTFLLAASKLGRIGSGIELNADNAEIAQSRGVQIIGE